ncbi:biopolymer transporter ExbD [Stappia sp. F7233]|uniref:Biopolymer transporter ExbD n=1 Tax=Stappia albiluteola TaxID=2758565 RepID=A0A839AAU6_9HYPH|nr:biopolymer transporter ExbD [Stappia albiluteola]MBA5776168.1 biopolymer transporter ExbD [Stappia albiluteola]
MRLKPFERRQGRETTIPLINVVFLMLIFFLFAGSLEKDDARGVTAPTSLTQRDRNTSDDALVVDAAGNAWHDGEELTDETLLALLAARAGEDRPLKIAADEELAAGGLKSVLRAARQAGVANIVLLTRKATP